MLFFCVKKNKELEGNMKYNNYVMKIHWGNIWYDRIDNSDVWEDEQGQKHLALVKENNELMCFMAI